MTEQAPESLSSEPETLRVGRSIVDRIRRETNDDFAYFQGDEGEDVFGALYVTERHGCLSERFIGDDLLQDIQALYRQVFNGIRDELVERLGRHDSPSTGPRTSIWLAVDPSYEDSTMTVMCTDEKVLLMYWGKAWNFYWESEEEMARELGRMYLAPTRAGPLPTVDASGATATAGSDPGSGRTALWSLRSARGRLGERAVHEDDSGPGSILLVHAHPGE